jgi:hypothetical protein
MTIPEKNGFMVMPETNVGSLGQIGWHPRAHMVNPAKAAE